MEQPKITLKQINNKMVDIKARDPLSLEQILKYDMNEYNERVRKQAISELNGDPINNPLFN